MFDNLFQIEEIKKQILIDKKLLIKTFCRPRISGRGTEIVLSKRPGRVSALSSDSGKFVAARNITPVFCSNLFNIKH